MRASRCSKSLLWSLLLAFTTGLSAYAACPSPFSSFASEPSRCYHYVPRNITWARAVARCRRLHRGATLAQFTSSTTAAAVAASLLSNDRSYWIDGILQQGSTFLLHIPRCPLAAVWTKALPHYFFAATTVRTSTGVAMSVSSVHQAKPVFVATLSAGTVAFQPKRTLRVLVKAKQVASLASLQQVLAA